METKKRAAELDFHAQLVALKKRQQDKEKARATLKVLEKETAAPILPRTYLVQKQKLMGVVFLCANLSKLRNTAWIYSQLNACNSRILEAAKLI